MRLVKYHLNLCRAKVEGYIDKNPECVAGIEKARKTQELVGTYRIGKGKGVGKKSKPQAEQQEGNEPEEAEQAEQVEKESEEPGDLVIDEAEEEY